MVRPEVNVAVGLKSKGLTVTSIADLKGLRVVAFGEAKNYLGPEFAAMATANKNYCEIADQQSQVKLLLKDRADILVMDINIFKYFRQSIKDVDVSKDVVFYQIFPPTAYKGLQAKTSATSSTPASRPSRLPGSTRPFSRPISKTDREPSLR